MRSSLLSLPPEILCIVGEMLDLADVKRLRLSSRQLGVCLELIALHNISFHVDALNVFSNSGISKLHYIATAQHSGPSRLTKHLVIDCLAPEYDPNFEAESFVDGQWVVNVPPTDQPQFIVARKQMKLYLFHALKSLKNLRSVSWKIHQHDEEWTQHTVMKALQALPNLRSVRIEIDWARIPLPLHRLRNLHRISVINFKPSSDSANAHETHRHLAKMISRSSQLIGIEIQRCDYGCTRADIGTSLHQLFWYYPASRAPLRLKHLVISGLFVKLDSITLPHFRQLKSLDLSSMLEPQHKVSMDPNFIYDTDFSSPCTNNSATSELIGSSFDELWLVLTDSGIELEDIKVRKVTTGFLHYLESYSGVKRLQMFSSSDPTIPVDCDALASRFFGTSLGRHVKTIENLDIEATNEGLWCFGSHNMPVIASCPNLLTLGVSISSVSLKISSCADEPVLGSEPLKRNDKFDPIMSLYDTISCRSDKIHTLRVSIPTNIDRFEGYWCGYSVSQTFSWVCDVIAERLCASSLDRPCPLSRGLPVITIGEKSCKERRLAIVTAPSVAAVDQAQSFNQFLCYREGP